MSRHKPTEQPTNHPKWALEGRFALVNGGYVLDNELKYPEAPRYRIINNQWVRDEELTAKQPEVPPASMLTQVIIEEKGLETEE